MSRVNSIPAIDTTIQLHDARTLGYIEYGNPQGKPLFYFHGHPGSRFEAGFLAEQAQKNNIRLIGVDRPGLGRSTYKAGRHFLDWPDDVVELAERLSINRFAVVGFSGGSPYALACACKIPDRLTACGVVSGVGYTGRFLSFLSPWLPWLILPITKRFFRHEEQARNTLTRFSTRWVEADRTAISDPKVRDTLTASLVESLRQGIKGAAYDGTLVGGRNWGFEFEEITFPEISLWHGELDKSIPITQARKVAESIAHCKAHYYPNEGHISTIVNHQEEIASALSS
jgi:pimeloyl-ACP methyl ester carboxylesterase